MARTRIDTRKILLKDRPGEIECFPYCKDQSAFSVGRKELYPSATCSDNPRVRIEALRTCAGRGGCAVTTPLAPQMVDGRLHMPWTSGVAVPGGCLWQSARYP